VTAVDFGVAESRLVLPFWYRLTRVVLDKGPLNGCVCYNSDAVYAYQYCNNLFISMLQVADDVIDINLQSAVSLLVRTFSWSADRLV